ncbi:MAG: sigma 54-interacting transcriptional regulator, partial [Tissierellia bacterium]|nr:sigma 54-interacting transcriptional regulator [Tissierellia bacterium]
LKDGKKGFIEMANEGTLFLDEIGDAPSSFQVRLLRLLEEREFMRVGGTKPISVNFRLIASTNKNLYKLVNEGKFRDDLFFRLNSFPLYTLPLRSRKSDINYLFNYFLPIMFNDTGITLSQIVDIDVENFLNNYDWPGNVRELKNICSYMRSLKKTTINLSDLPRYMFEKDTDNITLSTIERAILKIISENPNIGRNRIANLLQEKEINIGEGSIRSIINKLSENGFIIVGNTKRGSSITDKGLSVL